MSMFAEAGMIIVYLLLFGGSIVLGYYLMLVVKNRCGSKAKDK